MPINDEVRNPAFLERVTRIPEPQGRFKSGKLMRDFNSTSFPVYASRRSARRTNKWETDDDGDAGVPGGRGESPFIGDALLLRGRLS